MAENFIKYFIKRYIENRFSEATEQKFKFWLSKNKDDEKIDAALHEIWEESSGQITEQTLSDLERLKLDISKESKPQKTRRILPPSLLKYAAVILLLLSSSIITYLVIQPQEITYTECTVPKAEQKSITLPDGTLVQLNAGSSLIYPTTFKTKNRSIFLSGEAIFKVTKNPHKPFIVQTKNISVQALGTTFNVQAYPESSTTTTTLIEGKVRIDNKFTDETHDLKPDQEYSFNNTNHLVTISEVDAEKACMWEQGYLVFKDVAFDEIVASIERKYNVQVLFNQAEYEQFHCNVKFNPDESIQDVMSILCAITSKATFDIKGQQIIIHSK